MKRTLTTLLFTFAISTASFASIPSVNPAQVVQDKKAFIQALVTKDHFNREKLTALLRSQHPDKKILASMTAPFEKQPWTYYHNFFLTPERITLGAQYLKNHHRELMSMQKKYGIPASIIVAIIGVETEYGLHLGKYSVLNALYTLGFYYPPREKFFRSELAQYLILTRDNHLPVKSIKGSYAGALGIPQFMPSSYRHYGVSERGNGRVNLFDNGDAIASVANYFHKMGWKPNQPILTQLSSKYELLPHPGMKRIVLPLKNGAEYWGAYPNFNAIMSYNHNVVYVMAVYELSKAVEKQYAENKREANSRTLS